MELALFVYLASFVESLGVLFTQATIAVIVATVVFLIVIFYQMDVNGEPFSQFYKTLRNLCVSVFCLGFFTAAIPSEKTMYMMAGAYATQSVVQSETMQKVVDLVNLRLDEELAKVKPKE